MEVIRPLAAKFVSAVVEAFLREGAKDYIKSWFTWVPTAALAAPEIILLGGEPWHWRDRVFVSLAIIGGLGFFVVGVRMIFLDRLVSGILLRLLPVALLNSIDAADKRFTDADSLPLYAALSHVWNWKVSREVMKGRYWDAVEEGNVRSNFKSRDESPGFMKAWSHELLKYWHTLDQIDFLEVNKNESVKKKDFRGLLKQHKIPWPLTWR